jgi:hypothetical protein
MIQKHFELAYFSIKASAFFLTVRRRTRRNEPPWMGLRRVRKKEDAFIEKYLRKLSFLEAPNESKSFSSFYHNLVQSTPCQISSNLYSKQKKVKIT